GGGPGPVGGAGGGPVPALAERGQCSPAEACRTAGSRAAFSRSCCCAWSSSTGDTPKRRTCRGASSAPVRGSTPRGCLADELEVERVRPNEGQRPPHGPDVHAVRAQL